MKIYLSLGLIFLLFPLIFLVIGISFGVNTYNRIHAAQVVEGTIVSHNEKRDSNGTQYASIVEFKNLNGTVQKDTEQVYSSPEPENIGKKVNVYIRNDGKATIGTFSNLWFLPIIFSSISLPFLVIGIVFLTVYFKIKSKIEYLRNFGRKIESAVYTIEQNRMISINKRNPYYVSSTFAVDGKEYTAKSDMTLKPITVSKHTVEILYDPNNPQKNILVL
jgi:hypothetical protein